jgi:HK97 gp10 family phage protein
MASTVEFIVLEDLLPAVIQRLPGAVDAVLSAGAQRMADYARANHPWHNVTGQTEASIRMEASGAHEFSFLGGGALPFLEWGTIHMPPFPTMRPAFDAVKPSIDDGLSRLTEQLI